MRFHVISTKQRRGPPEYSSLKNIVNALLCYEWWWCFLLMICMEFSAKRTIVSVRSQRALIPRSIRVACCRTSHWDNFSFIFFGFADQSRESLPCYKHRVKLSLYWSDLARFSCHSCVKISKRDTDPGFGQCSRALTGVNSLMTFKC